MNPYIIATVTGLAVFGLTYGAMASFSSESWREDLLALEAVPEPPPEATPRKAKAGRRGGKRRTKAGTSSSSKSRPPGSTTSSTTSTSSSTSSSAKTPPSSGTASAGRNAADEHYVQSGVYLKEKKVGLAIQELEKCLAIDPNYALAYRSLGIAQTLLGREKLATEYFEKFVKLAPKHRDTPRIKQIIADYYKRNPR